MCSDDRKRSGSIALSVYSFGDITPQFGCSVDSVGLFAMDRRDEAMLINLSQNDDQIPIPPKNSIRVLNVRA
jgi:hypothetical protein